VGSKTVTRSLKININGAEVDKSITNLNKGIRQLKKNLAAATNIEDRKKYNKELNEAYAIRKKMNEEIRGTQSLFSKIKKQLGPVGTAMAGAFSVGAIMNFAGQVIDTIKLFRELKQETKLLTGLQDEMLDNAVAGTKALADTFETDYKENLIAANALSKQFGTTYDEALKAMEKGYLAGANASGDMLNQLKEYAPLMKEANIDLDEMVALIAQTEKEGIFNDKGIDAIKEGMLKIREGTNATRDAMNGLGIDTKQVYKDLEEGNTSYFEVMQLVSGKLNEIEEQSPAVGTAIADIFGGPGEDAGLEYLQNIKNIDLELNNLIDTTDEYVRLKQEEIEVNKRLNETWVEMSEAGGLFNKMMVESKQALVYILDNYQLMYKGYLDIDNSFKNKTVNQKQQLDQNETDFREHMERMKKSLGDRYDFEALKVNYVKNLSDGIVQNQILALDDLETKTVSKTKSTFKKIDNLQKERDAKKAERDAAKEAKQDEREAAKEEKRLQKIEENALKEEELKARLKQESQQIANELEEENRLELEDQRLEREILAAETDEERTQLIIERTQYIATEQLKIEQRRDIERAKLANATEAEIAAIKKKYILAEQAVNINYQKDQKSLKQEEVKWEDMTQNQKLDLVRGGLSQAAELFNKNTAAYKAIKIAETLMTTYQAAMNSYNSLSVIPIVGPVLGGLAAAAAVAAGLKQVSQIRNTKEEKMPKYYSGGPTHSGNYSGGIDGMGGQYAVVHPNEYMIPEFVAQDNTDPVMPVVMQYLEAKRTGQSYAEGGAVTLDQSEVDTTVIPEQSGTSELISAINMLNQNLLNPQPAVAFFDNEQAAKVNTYQTEVEQARNGAIIN